jgi:hypothetical protein
LVVRLFSSSFHEKCSQYILESKISQIFSLDLDKIHATVLTCLDTKVHEKWTFTLVALTHIKIVSSASWMLEFIFEFLSSEVYP